MITSYFKSELDGDLHNSLLETMKAYNNYKKWFKFPSAIKGKIDLNLWTHLKMLFVIDYQWKNKLRYVRIYFDTPTFDRITKDRAAKGSDVTFQAAIYPL